MKQEFGERLAKYRKRKGLSQEQLSFELGVSRQAVSKWEREESSPDTDNLIELSKLYGISLDELLYKDPDDCFKNDETQQTDLNTETYDEKINQDQNEDVDVEVNEKGHKGKDYVHVGFDGIHVLDEDGDEVHIDYNGIKVNSVDKNTDFGALFKELFKPEFTKTAWLLNLITPVLMLVVSIIYLILGFTLPNNDGWTIYWTLFLIPMVISSLVKAIVYKYISKFNITMVASFIYLFLGMFLNLWHPTWIIFMAIPLFYAVTDPLDKYLYKKRKAKNSNVIDPELID